MATLAGATLGGATGYFGAKKDDPLGTKLLDAAVGALAGAAGGALLGAGLERGHVAADAFRKVFNPASRTPASQQAANIVRANLGALERDMAQAHQAILAVRGEVKPLTTPEGRRFVADIEQGAVQGPPALQAAAHTVRTLLDRQRDTIRGLGKGALAHFIEDYFPHIWEDPAQARDVIAQISGKRPLQGPKSFLKQRTIPTIEEGLAAGLKPVADHPLDLVLLKLREMRRYEMGQRILGELKAAGLVRFTRGRPDPGYQALNDGLFTVYAPPTPEGSLAIRGRYTAPEAVATVLNNFLSPGLRGNALFDVYMHTGNTLNQAQLGLSLFHLGFTSMDASVSKTALALEQIAAGQPGAAARSLVQVPVAPLTNYLRGSRLYRAYRVPGSEGAAFDQLADAVVAGGGRVAMPRIYKNNAIEKFMQALRRRQFGQAALQTLPAMLEAAAKPLMEHIVPRQKLGVFADLAQHELSRLPPGASPAEVRAAMGKVWDSVDNRMGQLVYDNLFWHKALKDLSMASVRSVGWNLGTVRELGGGTLDLRHLSRGKLTHRAAYVIALPITVGMAGGMLNYLYTGEAPKELKDYFMPRTGRFDAAGNPERVNLPSYMKDVFAYAKHPVRTVQHKLHPLLALIGDMLENENYYGDLIRNPDDPLVVQLRQEAQYLADAVLPFGVQNVLEEHQRTGGYNPGAFVGLVPASREEIRTPAQNKMLAYLGANAPSLRTPEQRETSSARGMVYRDLASRRTTRHQAQRALEATGMSRTAARAQLTRHEEEALVRQFQSLSLEQAERVFALGTPSEQALWMRVLRAKRRAAPRPVP